MTSMHRLRHAATGIALVVMTLFVTVADAGSRADVDAALARAQRAVERIIAVPDDERTFENTIGAMDDLAAQLELDTNMIMFMTYVSTDPEERELGQWAEEHVNDWLIESGKNEALYAAVQSYAATKPALRGEHARLLDFTLRDFRRNGMALSASDRARLTTVQKEISRLAIEFDRNSREDATVVPLSRAELAGLPDDYFQQLPEVDGLYLVGLTYPEFLPVMDLGSDEQTRKKLWIAYKRRGGQKNVDVLESILKLRAEEAHLLGYPTQAHYVIETRMAKTPETVRAFYEKLRPLVRRKAIADREELLEVKRRLTGRADATLYPWDTSYYTNIVRQEKYAVDSEKVREYFPLDRVTDGLFSITQSLYGITYRDVTDQASAMGRPLWHEDVRLFEVIDNASGALIGRFTIDLHPRPNKYTHAAQWGLAQHKVWANGDVTLPFAALVCNFTKPTADKPSLLSHDEVETYFHEFGHCLHTILSEAELWRFAGTSVERDFVEAPSQMFENWVWNADVLNTFAAHYETGEKLPPALLDGMLRAKNLSSGMLAERQFFYGLFDMMCHGDEDGIVDTTRLAADLWAPDGMNIELYAPVPHTFFQASFGHLMHYNAGYYGYQWSLVYACDMFQRFRELGMLDPEAGLYYRRHILARGGTVDGLDLVRDYLGREPDMTAYLKHLGLDE